MPTTKINCEVCEASYEIVTEDEDLNPEYCTYCGSLLFEEDEIEELEESDENDGW